MKSLPPARANLGSAVNDTTHELGGALGVAVVGSVMSSLYANLLTDTLPTDVPAPVGAAARESLGAAVQAGATFRPDVADAAREAFVTAMSRASLVVALVAALGAVVAWRYLPADDTAQPEDALVTTDEDSERHASAGLTYATRSAAAGRRR
jgi:MFS transporter, DHA2 family, multidrug resistance protein